MKEQIVCQQCTTRLRVPVDATGPVFTCPRCLAEVTLSPDTGLFQERKPSPSKLSTGRSCPYCDEPVQRDWVACPYCRADLWNWRPSRPQVRSLEVEVRQDRTLAGLGLIVLAGLGCIGSVSLLSSGTLSKLPVATAFFVFAVVFVVLATIAFVGMTMASKSRNSLLGTLVQVFGILVVLGLTALGGIAFLFFACFATMRN
jgi:hypothetical protein